MSLLELCAALSAIGPYQLSPEVRELPRARVIGGAVVRYRGPAPRPRAKR